ncbi:PIN-like domain-containing protein [Streptomyces qinglanensis]|uniref:PIN-like domain-containing protein n=1 Tax=Streptomyces qinglanensis TaxID=943816 RepID=UPI000943C4AC|nr:PIN-like domain-containing protein [Streptomyces qinglanensis]
MVSSEHGESRGLFSGFEGYRTPAPTEVRAALAHGVVVVDTNVLVDLYRMNRQVREDMLTVLEALSDRLWVPHQVLIEFWRNQQQPGVLGHHHVQARDTLTAMTKAHSSIGDSLKRWARAVHLSEDAPIRDELNQLEGELDATLSRLREVLERQAKVDQVPGAPDTSADPVIGKLEGLLQGKVGAAPTDEQLVRWISEARERAQRRQPPGFRDFDDGKPDQTAAGDYIVWRQLSAEVAARGKDVVFVTRDLKEDWWRTLAVSGDRLPRIELVHELRAETGQQLYMLEPSGLLDLAQDSLDLRGRVASTSVDALRQMESESSTIEWSEETLCYLLATLQHQSPVRFQVLLQAGRANGFVDRETVYRLGGYEPNRMLRGFTRPVATAARRLQALGLIRGTPEELLRAVYDGDVLAAGFDVPDYTIPILKRIAQNFDTHGVVTLETDTDDEDAEHDSEACED